MHFPFYIDLGPLHLHPHPVFEALAYFIGFRVYLYTRSKERMPTEQAIWVIVGAIIGGALGSKILYWFEDPVQTLHNWHNFTYLMEGKTIVGGLLGGLIGVEIAKKKVGITRSTGDEMVFPLIIGISIGRVGCFLTGLSDHTYGTPTTWWTGVDFGDGIPRHPTQLYEIFLLLLLGVLLFWMKWRMTLPEGGLFQLFMIGYLLMRLGLDTIKPTPHPYWIFNNIQVACLIGLVYYITLLRKWRSFPQTQTKGM